MVRPGRIGDFVCATPAFRSLREALPDAEVTLVGLPFAADLVARSEDLDDFEPFPGFPGIADQWFEPAKALDFLVRMQRRRFDLAVQLYGSGRYSNPVTLLLGARWTAGFVHPDDRDPGLLDAAVPLPASGHEIERTLALPRFLGAPAASTVPSFPLWPVDHEEADAARHGLPDPLVVVHAAASDEGRTWGPRHLADTLHHLRARLGGSIAVIGGPGQRRTAGAVAEAVGGCVRNVAGHLSLPATGALLTQAAVVLTTDSGPAHLAYAVGAPSVTAYGTTSPKRWGPPVGGPQAVVRLDDPPEHVAEVAVSVSSPAPNRAFGR